MIEHLKKYEATLKIRRDPHYGEVKPDVLSLDGARFRTRALWRIDCAEDEFANPVYDGEWAMETPMGWPIIWVASGDLAAIKAI